MPWFWDLVQLSTEIPLLLLASKTLLKEPHNQVFNNNPQYLNLYAWSLRDSSRNKASLWKWQRELLPLKGHQQGSFLKNGAEKNLVDFSTPSVKQVSDFFMSLYQDLTGPHQPLMIIGRPFLTICQIPTHLAPQICKYLYKYMYTHRVKGL